MALGTRQAGSFETTGEDSIFYLHGLDLVAQSDGVNTEYFAYDGLGSVRQVVDDAASVLLAQTYDPYGSVYESVGAGETNFGFTGEQVDASGLVYLRARYYSPTQGRFFQRDTWRGDPNQPQTLNPYMYGLGNPVLYTDPSGKQAKLPSLDDWLANGGSEVTYWEVSLRFVFEYRRHIIAAAQRHNFIPQRVDGATSDELEVLYTLAAIVYQEAHGYYEDDPYKIPIATPNNFVDLAGITMPYVPYAEGGSPTLGVGQVRRDTTAVEIEEAGLLFDPGTEECPNTARTPAPSSDFSYTNWSSRGQGGIVYCQEGDYSYMIRGMRLLDPVWGIEYAAANMEWATHQGGFGRPWAASGTGPDGEDIFIHEGDLTVTERMTAWHARGHFRISIDPDLVGYLHRTYDVKTAIRNLNLLAIGE